MVVARLKSLWVLAVSALLLAGPAAAGAQTLVLAAANTHPTAFLVDGKPTGILVDLVTEAFRREGYAVTIKLMPWARCLESARSGEVDGVFSSFKLPEREKFLDFTKEPLGAQNIVFFARRDAGLKFDGDFGALHHATIGVILGTSYGERLDAALRDGDFGRVEESNSIESSLRKLALGRVDLVPSFRDVAEAEAKRLELSAQIVALPRVIEIVPTYLAFPPRARHAPAGRVFRSCHRGDAAGRQLPPHRRKLRVRLAGALRPRGRRCSPAHGVAHHAIENTHRRAWRRSAVFRFARWRLGGFDPGDGAGEADRRCNQASALSQCSSVA